MNYLNVEKLLDIVNSQSILFGNRPVFAKLPPQCQEVADEFFLHAEGKLIIEATSYDDACVKENGLETIEERLKSLNPQSLIEHSHNAPMNTGFELGFKADSQFVQVISSNEIEPQVAVE
ncbi:hypothetical protein TUMSATVNIG1_61190 (plasmid) [Vibrio nigripulchritudo]|uniref:hypothetical protein n=1 Tax=Vibrio nigripulchritudo TaxID=28173 RepID=UPI001909B346|nr:hypothetical protein [Vibrio nigripulchritudo]BCL74135.1 hypothetical protein VNTUMSATTG_60720 [Vibrio nigripulchritudo]BDU35510.1 hypothetical protein TUMSATVNIG1_61190 [Vibrio nigripulchritudo]